MFVIELALGIIIGIVMSIMPGMSSIIGAIIAAPFGTHTVLATVVTSLFAGTLKEIYTPELSGDPLISMIVSKDQYLVRALADRDLIDNLLQFKLLAALVGTIIGILTGFIPIPFMEPAGFEIFPIVAAVVVIFAINFNQEIKDRWIDLVLYLLVTSLWFKVSNLAGLGQPVLTFALCCFVLFPLLEDNFPYETKERELNNYRFSFPWIQLPLYLVFSGAGVNYDLFNTHLNNTTKVFTNGLFLKTLFEFAAIAKMYIAPTNVSGITEIASEVSEANIFFAIAIALLTALFTPMNFIVDTFVDLSKDQRYRKLGAGLIIFLIVTLCGWFTPFFLITGYVFSKQFRGLSLQVQGLLFLSPLLF